MAQSNTEEIKAAILAAHKAGDTASAARMTALLDIVEPDLPAFGAKEASFFDRQKAALLMRISPDPQAQADIIQRVLPEAKITRRNGGLIEIEYKGERGLLNPPGLDSGDVADFAWGIFKYIPATKLAGLGRTLGGRAAIGAAASGATSLMEDAAARGAGSQQGADLNRAAWAAGGGAAGELVAPMMTAAMARFRGVDPTDIATNTSARVQQEQARAAQQAVTPEAIDSVARARSFGVNSMTRGQATGNREMLNREWMLANRGGLSQDIMEGQSRRLNQEIIGSADNPTGLAQLQQELGGTGRTLPQSADDVVQGVRSTAANMGRQVDDAYDAARAANASIEPEAAVDAFRSIRRGVARSGVAVTDDMAQLNRVMSRATRYRTSLAQRLREGQPTRPQTLRVMENFRGQISTAAQNAGSPAERRAITSALREWDAWMDDAFARDLIGGDEGALEAWKNARGLRRHFGKIFERGKPQGSVVDDAGGVMERLLKGDITPEEGANAIFGASDLGGRQSAYRVIKRLKTAWAEEPEKLDALRELAFNVMVKRATGRNGEITYNNLYNALREGTRGKGRAMAEMLWSPEQMQRIDEFVEVLASVKPRSDVGNPSRTAVVGEQILREWLGPLSSVLSAFKIVMPTNAFRALEAATATRAPTMQVPAAIRATAPAAAGTTQDERNN
jgi:hypothetical protein